MPARLGLIGEVRLNWIAFSDVLETKTDERVFSSLFCGEAETSRLYLQGFIRKATMKGSEQLQMPECRWCQCCGTLHVFSSSTAAGVQVGGKPQTWRGCDSMGAASRMLCVQEVNRLWQPPRLFHWCTLPLWKASKLILLYPSLCQTV